jgi:hypothetical protein
MAGEHQLQLIKQPPGTKFRIMACITRIGSGKGHVATIYSNTIEVVTDDKPMDTGFCTYITVVPSSQSC